MELRRSLAGMKAVYEDNDRLYVRGHAHGGGVRGGVIVKPRAFKPKFTPRWVGYQGTGYTC
jgi:hypothetical protein